MAAPARDRPGTAGNDILRDLPAAEHREIRPLLTPVPLCRGDRLIEPERPVAQLHFPHSGLVSVTVELRDGRSIEAAAIGPEGVAGLDALLTGGTGLACGIVQLDGTAARVETAVLLNRLAVLPVLRRRLRAYAGGLARQILQAPACIASHDATARLARWLLETHDRAGGARFALTHEVAAVMLGVRRPTVSLVAGRLGAAGLVRYRRGVVEVIDREGLEAAACECYAAVRFARRRSPRSGFPGSRGDAGN